MTITVTYPLDRNSAGEAFWKVLFQKAATYPVTPTDDDKRQFKEWFKGTLRAYPCSACREHSKEYIMKQPPDISSREKLFDWMCRFENNVRDRQGKEPLLCQLSEHGQEESSSSCPSCSINHEPKDLKSTFKDFKHVSITMFEELCKREKIPMPEILFAPCPSAPFTSCTHMEKDLLSAKVKQDKSVVYLNPNQYSPRTIYHEFLHYAFLMKGKDDVGLDEWEVERIAQEQMEKEFPYDQPKKEEKPLLVVKDTSPFNQTIPRPRNYLDETNARIAEEFPMFTKYKQMEQQKEIEAQQASEAAGFLSIFDSLYQPFSDAFGLSARALNEMHTSNILASSATTLMQSNLSPFGSLVASLATGLGLLGVGIMGKKTLSVGDRRFLNTMGAYFLWNNIAYSNPKLSGDVISDGKTAVDAARSMNFEQVKQLMVETPEMLTGKKALATEAQAQQQHEARISARRSRRTGGGGGMPLRRRGRAPIGGKPDILRRMEQRAAGLPEAPDVTKYRQFPTDYVPRGGGGEFMPNEPEIGEGSPITNTFPFYTGEQDFEDEYGDLV